MSHQRTQSADPVDLPDLERSRVGETSGAAAALSHSSTARSAESRAEASAFESALRFARLQRDALSPSYVFTPRIGDRPAPLLRRERSWMLLILALGSIAAHGAMLTLFDTKAPPPVSIGLEAISVELVMGANAAAGVAALPDPSQQNVSVIPMPDEGQDLSRTQMAAIDVKRIEATPPSEAADTQEPAPVETETLRETPATEALPVVPPTPRPRPIAKPETTRPQAKPHAKSREAALQLAPVSDADRRPRQVFASNMSSGVGVGRSDATPEYRGIVAAHLARHKQFPDDARRVGAQGNATVTFGIDADGRVTSVELVSGAGHPGLDQEARAMVHRASPFPPPPGGLAVNFTVPVAFNLR